MQVGTGARAEQWAEVGAKVAQRAMDIRASSQGTCARMRLYNGHLATHRGRFAELDAHIVQRMRHAAQGFDEGSLDGVAADFSFAGERDWLRRRAARH